jgi:hypothetical protein
MSSLASNETNACIAVALIDKTFRLIISSAQMVSGEGVLSEDEVQKMIEFNHSH